MEARKVNALNGWLWIKQGYWLFRKTPLLWMSLSAIGVIGMLGITAIPVVGDPLATLLFPVLLAGYMLGCHALAQGEELELAHLFAGFQQRAQQLVTLGGINLVSQLLILGVMKFTGGAALVDIMMSGQQVDDPAALVQAMEGAGIALLLGITLFSVLIMAMQFAPMLVIFGEMPPVPALKASLRAFLRNMIPLTVYGAMLVPFALLASLPMMLGWLILLPIVITSMYAIYRDLFPEQLSVERTRSPNGNSDEARSANYAEDKLAQQQATVKDAAYYCMLLEVALDASKDDVQKAYKVQMQKYHPDRVAHLGKEWQDIAEQKTLELREALAYLMKLKSK